MPAYPNPPGQYQRLDIVKEQTTFKARRPFPLLAGIIICLLVNNGDALCTRFGTSLIQSRDQLRTSFKLLGLSSALDKDANKVPGSSRMRRSIEIDRGSAGVVEVRVKVAAGLMSIGLGISPANADLLAHQLASVI